MLALPLFPFQLGGVGRAGVGPGWPPASQWAPRPVDGDWPVARGRRTVDYLTNGGTRTGLRLWLPYGRVERGGLEGWRGKKKRGRRGGENGRSCLFWAVLCRVVSVLFVLPLHLHPSYLTWPIWPNGGEIHSLFHSLFCSFCSFALFLFSSLDLAFIPVATAARVACCCLAYTSVSPDAPCYDMLCDHSCLLHLLSPLLAYTLRCLLFNSL